MSDHKRLLRDYPCDPLSARVRVEVFYSKGSPSMCRGYWLHIYPCRVENGMLFVTLGAGGRRLLATAKRYSPKGMDDAAWKAEGWLIHDDPGVRQSIAACGGVNTEEVPA